MAKSHQVKSALALFAAGTMLVAGGCSDGTSIDNPPGSVQFSESGRLLQPPVSGATVCLDLNCNGVCDIDVDAFAPHGSNSEGFFEFFGNYQQAQCTPILLSEGGTIINSTGNPVAARNMSAPAGALVVSMLTTLQMATPPEKQAALVAQLNALAGGVDYWTVDFFADPVPRELMVAVKTVEALVDGFAFLGAGSVEQQNIVLRELGKTIVADNSNSALPALVNTAAQSAFSFLRSSIPTLQVTTIPDLGAAMAAVATAVANAIPRTQTMKESELPAAVEADAKAAVEELTAVVTSWVKLDLASVALTTPAVLPEVLPEVLSWTPATLPSVLTLNALPSSLAVTAAATNTTEAAQVFDNVKVKLTVAQATRNIVLSIGGLKVDVAANGTLTLTKGTEPLVIKGSSNVTQVQFDMADTTWGTASGATVTFDLNALNTQLRDNGGRDLNTLAASGDYLISAEVTGAPFVALTKALKLTIQ